MKKSGKWAVYISILLVVLTVSLAAGGCVRGMSAIGWSGIGVGDNALYVGSAEGRLVAIKADGTTMLSEPLKTEKPSGGCMPSADGSSGGGCASSSSVAVAIYGIPVVSGEMVYITAYNGKVYAYDSPSLEMKWVYPVEDYLKPIVGGVALAGERLYFATTDGKLVALDAVKGIKRWEISLGSKIWSTPVIDNGTVFIGSFDNKVYAIDAETGNRKWEFPTNGTITATALVYQDIVYIGSFDCNMYAIDAINGTEKWHFKADKWFWTKPVIHKDILYAGSLDGNVYALDIKNGEKLGNFEVGPVASSPALAGSSIIVANQKGEVSSYDTVTHKRNWLVDLKVPVSAPLAISQKKVYAHTSNLVVHPIDIDTGKELSLIILNK